MSLDPESVLPPSTIAFARAWGARVAAKPIPDAKALIIARLWNGPDHHERTETYPLTSAQIREKRRQRDIARHRSDLERLSWERRELLAEYERVSGTYRRHLERIKAKAVANAEAMKALADKTAALTPQPPQADTR